MMVADFNQPLLCGENMKTKLLLFYLTNFIMFLILFYSCNYFGETILNDAALIKSLLMLYFILGLVYSMILTKFKDVYKD